MKYLAVLLSAAWAACALWYPSPPGRRVRMAVLVAWLLLTVLVLCALWRNVAAWLLLVDGVAFALITLWWITLKPSNQRLWRDELVHMASGEVQGNQVTLHHVRNFDWRSESDYSPRWEVRHYDLDRLIAVDMLLSYWTGPAVAHTLVSFGFEDGSQVAFSVEIRKEQDEQFSELGGFFKRFELSIIAADERDIVRVRTNVRREDVYLYRVALTPEARRSLFLVFIAEANQLAAQPRFYNTLTVNCTTLIYQMMTRIVPGLPRDYRLLLSGYLPGYVYSVGGLDSRYELAQLRAMGRISERARRADHAENFSVAIRAGIPPLPPRL